MTIDALITKMRSGMRGGIVTLQARDVELIAAENERLRDELEQIKSELARLEREMRKILDAEHAK